MRRGPQQINTILAELMARRGFARVQSAARYDDAWRQAAGSLAAQYTKIGALRGGKLEVIVANSTLVQELAFQKADLVKALTQLLPNEGIRDLCFRVGVLS